MNRPTIDRLLALSLVAAAASVGAAPFAVAQPTTAGSPAAIGTPAATGTPATAGTPAATPTAPPASTGSSNAATAVTASAADRQAEAGINRRIADLHARLGITSAEEPAWSSFTAVMRENMEGMNGKLAARKTAFGSMSAVDDLRSYADIVSTQAAGIERLVGPFGTLYAELTPAQRTKADQIFRSYTDRTIRTGVEHRRG